MLNWTQFAGDTPYAKVGWWWCGVESATGEQTALAEILDTVGPDSFRHQAVTWATILADHLGSESSEDESENYEASITALTLAYWLAGFDAATENSFFDFSARTAYEASGLDRLRVGFEAGRSHQAGASGLAEYLDLCDDDFSDSCLIACLDLRISELRDSLSKTFGGDAALFWSLYSSIFPNLKVPMCDGMDAFFGSVEMAEIDRPWRFVAEGWIDLEEQ